MNHFVNKVSMTGNISTEPHIIHFGDGKKVARFQFATHETYPEKGGRTQTITSWHSVFAWGKEANVIEQAARKGIKLAIEGMLVNRPYETPEGEKRYKTEIRANKVVFI
jgi:single-strand DNA-binding protein